MNNGQPSEPVPSLVCALLHIHRSHHLKHCTVCFAVLDELGRRLLPCIRTVVLLWLQTLCIFQLRLAGVQFGVSMLPLDGCSTPHMQRKLPHTSSTRVPGPTPPQRKTQVAPPTTSSPYVATLVSPSPTPTMLIIGDSIIRNFHTKLAKTYCFPGATVSDLADKIPRLLDKHPTMSKCVIHVGTNNINCQQPELLKHDFTLLFNLLKEHCKHV